MQKRILIIEDTVNDLPHYAPLFDGTREVSFLFLTREADFTKEKLENLAELVSENLFKKVKKFFAVRKEDIENFLKEHTFDFYIIDSLAGFGESLTKTLPQGHIAFFTSTSAFKDLMEKQGLPAYKKNEMQALVSKHLL